MNKLNKITVCFDMAGCPNRCKHCWIGVTKNGRLEIHNMVSIAERFKKYTKELEVFSWYREPDYRDDYKDGGNIRNIREGIMHKTCSCR